MTRLLNFVDGCACVIAPIKKSFVWQGLQKQHFAFSYARFIFQREMKIQGGKKSLKYMLLFVVHQALYAQDILHIYIYANIYIWKILLLLNLSNSTPITKQTTFSCSFMFRLCIVCYNRNPMSRVSQSSSLKRAYLLTENLEQCPCSGSPPREPQLYPVRQKESPITAQLLLASLVPLKLKHQQQPNACQHCTLWPDFETVVQKLIVIF